MAQSEPFDQSVIALGKRLAAKLAEHDRGDLLSAWMAHHIAELINTAESAKGTPAEVDARQACMNAILQLWKHRDTLPRGIRPFEKAEAAMMTLARLNPDHATHFYFPETTKVSPATTLPEDDNGEDWLAAAEAIDQAARRLIRFCIGKAARPDLAELNEWLNDGRGLLRLALPFDIQFVELLNEVADDAELDALLVANHKEVDELRGELDRLMRHLQRLRELLDVEREQ